MGEKRVVEIGGVKLEVDLEHARVVENYRVGDNVKLLKKLYGDTFRNYTGVIIGFDNFKERPTIVVAYVDSSSIELAYINKDTNDMEMCPMNPDEVVIDKQQVIEQLDRKIASAEAEVVKAKSEKEFFTRKFGQYFEAGEKIEKILNS